MKNTTTLLSALALGLSLGSSPLLAYDDKDPQKREADLKIKYLEKKLNTYEELQYKFKKYKFKLEALRMQINKDFIEIKEKKDKPYFKKLIDRFEAIEKFVKDEGLE